MNEALLGVIEEGIKCLRAECMDRNAIPIIMLATIVGGPNNGNIIVYPIPGMPLNIAVEKLRQVADMLEQQNIRNQ